MKNPELVILETWRPKGSCRHRLVFSALSNQLHVIRYFSQFHLWVPCNVDEHIPHFERTP
jgi:hypothetical protein